MCIYTSHKHYSNDKKCIDFYKKMNIIALFISERKFKKESLTMKKIIAILLAALLVLSFGACAKGGNEDTTSDAVSTEATDSADTTAAADEFKYPTYEEVAPMTAEEFAAAEVDSLVCVETYVQANQSWWENKITVYTQTEDAGYFLYEMPCTEEDAAKLTAGTKIKVTGYKSEWSGEVEITDAAFEILEADAYKAEPVDVTALYGTDDLAKEMNKLVSIKGAKVAAKGDDGAAFLYKWDGSGEQGDDIYFDVEIGGQVYTLTVESYLCGKDTDVYKAAEALKVGDTVDVVGFLYWYEGAQPHVTSITAA